MARRSRVNRQSIPGYDEQRPNRDDRRRDHRKARHAANQKLHSIADPEELAPLPEVRRSRDREPLPATEPERRRFKVWKTPFWKRRDHYQDMKAELDSRWEEVTAPPEEEDW